MTIDRFICRYLDVTEEEMRLIVETEHMADLLRRIEPHIDAIVCYASTTDEHDGNALAVEVRALLGRLDG